jgi:hypothetical protein
MKGGHCWHNPTGGAMSTLMSGGNTTTEMVQCCWCGTNAIRKTKEVRVEDPRHGSFYKGRYERVADVDVEGPCQEHEIRVNFGHEDVPWQ